MPVEIGNTKAYSLLEASKKIKVTTLTLRNYIKSGRLQATKVGGRWYLTEENLEKLFSPREIHLK